MIKKSETNEAPHMVVSLIDNLFVSKFLKRRGWFFTGICGLHNHSFQWEKIHGFRKHILIISAITGKYYLKFCRMDGKEARTALVVSPDRHLPAGERPENMRRKFRVR